MAGFFSGKEMDGASSINGSVQFPSLNVSARIIENQRAHIGADSETMDAILEKRYSEILETLDPAFLNHVEAKERRLSTPFLVNGPSDPDARRIMVIGREYGGNGWNVMHDGGGASVYVTKALSKHRDFFGRAMAKKGQDRGDTFFNFMRALARSVGSEGGLIYSNLLCFDSGGKSPRNSEHFSLVKRLSKQLLDVQLDHFRPDVVIFANGMDTVGIRREFFPIAGDGKVCVGRRHWEEAGIPRTQLWEFELHGRFLCYRIQHPSARSRAAKAARKQLLEVISQTTHHNPTVFGGVEGTGSLAAVSSSS
ncbi:MULTISPECIES: hypothetical protein [unclassified Caballeronia]|uniref:hypothetical protein n=1 Tax=unclassified Caballeronia TaxID=2646786 RepID=UPI0028608848|nr:MULTISPECIES: hypothetical protein [unclassified Caballeronia]MDR5821505.1 hypothetical protein [Caballeronia sp. LZ043]